MERKMKKWLSFMTAAAMVIAMASTGFADPISTTDPNLSIFGGTEVPNVGVATGSATLANKVSFEKVIVVEGGGNEAVDEPDVSWKYTIRGVNNTDAINENLTAGGTLPDVKATYTKGTTVISDGTNTIYVEPGTAAQLTASTEVTAAFKWDQTDISGMAGPTAKQTFTRKVTFNFNTAGFTKPGVYRFVIKEEKLTTGKNAGDVEDVAGEGEDSGVKKKVPYQPERFLDVYVRKNAAGTAYEIYGYVMHSGDTTKTSNEHGNKWTGHKNSGYDGGSDKGTNHLTPQGYTRYTVRKLKVRKKISGLIPTDKKFPFEIRLLHGGTTAPTNDIPDFQVKIKYPDFVASPPSTYKVMKISEINAATFLPELKDGEEVEIIGLPINTSVEVREKNGFVGKILYDMQAYTSIGFEDAKKDGAAVTGQPILSTGTDTQIHSAKVTKSLKDNDVGLAYHNHVDDITPTGVVLTVVPYAMMVLVAFSMAFMFLTKRKEE